MGVLGAIALGLSFWSGSSGNSEPLAPRTAMAGATPPPQAAPADFQTDLLPFIHKYCSDCHGNGAQEGDFALDRYSDLAGIRRDRAVWTKLLKLVELGSMPPSTAEQPSVEERQKAVAWLEHQLYFVDCSVAQNPGRVTVRRLNKTEYNNTVNALLGVNFKPADDFPSDDVGHGFDNIGDVLTVPPLLIEKYLAAAESIAQAVVNDASPAYFHKRLTYAELNNGKESAGSEGVVFASHGRTNTPIQFPRKGPYEIIVSARQDRGGTDNAQMVVWLGDRKLRTIEVKNDRRFVEFKVPFEAAAGTHSVSVEFINDFYDAKAERNKDRNLHIGSVEVNGPLDVTADERQQMFLTRTMPNEKITPTQAAASNLKEFLPRAFRRPVTDAELSRYTGLVEMAIQHGSSFVEAMGVATQAILVSPDFLFRVEGGRRQQGDIEMLDDYALASRLSYFLWSSCPDEELFELARQQQLHEPDVLKAQTLRMLQDPRSQELVENFASQWLGLRKLGTAEIDPDPKLFPEFKKEIREDLWKETELYFAHILRTDRSIFELLTGEYSFLNERLAKFYGIEGVTGPEFRLVDLKGLHRHGLMTQGSILTLTSYPNRTSPVKRGEWVLSALLGDAPPPPPPTVPGLEKTATANPNLSFRESLELHRADPGCASCHKTMDAIGFGLENFDAIGRWRTEERNRPVDASGVFPSGEAFNGPDELMSILIGKRDDFSRCLSEKMLTYAIGRGVEWYDRCTVDDLVADLEKDDRISSLILGIVESAPFQARKIQEPVADVR